MLTLILVLAAVPDLMVAADSTVTVNVKGRYGQTEARSMLKMINDFRTGEEAWEWNSDNQTKKYHSNQAPLTYDYDLEQAAMLRAMEIALSFNHTRPNGTSCFTIAGNLAFYRAENLLDAMAHALNDLTVGIIHYGIDECYRTYYLYNFLDLLIYSIVITFGAILRMIDNIFFIR